MSPTLIIGNKNYSSWSLRAWLALKQAGVAFEEVLVPLYQPNTKEAIRAHTPSGRVPALRDGDVIVWDSLAICEYVAEAYPDARLWPDGRAARAVARAVTAEMHSGFDRLRAAMPMDIRNSYPGKGRTPAVLEDIARITTIWRECRGRYGGDGEFLFGDFCIADAFYAPVVTRFTTYGVDLDDVCGAYARAVLALPAMQEWSAAAHAEPYSMTH